VSGGIGAIHRMARQTGLSEAIDERLEVLLRAVDAFRHPLRC